MNENTDFNISKILEIISKSNYVECLDIEEALENRINDIKASDLLDIPNYGDLIPIKDFEEAMLEGMFTINDGSGYYATKDKYSHLPFIFYDLQQDNKIKKYGFTHIMWFNK